MSADYKDGDEEPGVPGRDTDKDGRSYFFPSNRQRPADSLEQWDGFTLRWEYCGHTDAIKSVCVTGEDSLGRIRVASTDGKGIHSWLELRGDVVKAATSTQFDTITGIIFVAPLDVLAAASRNNLLIFERRTLKHLATLPTSKTLVHLEYNPTRDEIISGGSEGCYVWRLVSLRVAVGCDGCYAPVTAPFELALLRGFKGCSQWTGKMVWDEPGQVIIAIDGTVINVCDVTTGANLHRIEGAHDTPVTAAMWFGESEHIVTGCVSGILKMWACQHTDVRGTKNSGMSKSNNRRRSRKRNNGRNTGTRKRVRRRRLPALMASFRAHCGIITGLVRHCMNSALIISSSADGTLRLWDVDQLAPVSTIRIAGGAVESIMAHSNPGGGRPRLLCTGKGGNIRTMLAHMVCEPLGDIPQETRRIRYYPPPPPPPFSGNKGMFGVAIAPSLNATQEVKGNRATVPLPRGFLLVQMRQGLWGVMSESRILTTESGSVSRFEAESQPRPRRLFKEFSQNHQRQKVVRQWQQNRTKDKDDDGETTEALYEGNKHFALFDAWAPLPSVAERYTHHALSCRRREVICLTDSGLVDAYRFGSERGEARKVGSWKVELQSNAAKATCMCLLPTTPAFLVATLDRLIAAHGPVPTGFGTPRGGVGKAGGGEGGNNMRELYNAGAGAGAGADAGGAAGTGGGAGRWSFTDRDCWKGDQVIAIGTSHGAVILVETIVNGTTLACLEGVFAGTALDIAFCDASDNTASITGTSSGRTSPERLLCTGYNANGTVTIKGLVLPSLSEAFSIGLVEVPTCLGVASTQTLLAVGYVDGTVQVIQFAEDRVCELESSAQTGAHKAKIETIAFSERYHCMATGSADGDVNIWDAEGNLLHSIHLQDPVRTVAFTDLAGQLVVSQATGMCRIPASRWCPQRLLVAVERAERRLKLGGNTTNSGVSGTTGGPTEGGIGARVSTEIESPPTGGGDVTIRVDDEGENPFSDSSTEEYSQLEQQREGLVVCTTTSEGRHLGGGIAGSGECSKINQQGNIGPGGTIPKNPCIGKGFYPAAAAAAAAASRQSTMGGGRDQKRAVSAQECIMPSEIMGDGGGTFTVIRRPIQKERPGIDLTNTRRSDVSMSILDRMKAKVAGMATSPPPLDVRAAKMGEPGGEEYMLQRSATNNGTVVQLTGEKPTAVPLIPLGTVTKGKALVPTTTCSPFMSAPAAAECSVEYSVAFSEEDPDIVAEAPFESAAGVTSGIGGAEGPSTAASPGTMDHPGVVLGTPEGPSTSSVCCSPRQRRDIISRLVGASRREKLLVGGQRQTTGTNYRKPISRTRDSPTRCISACENSAAAVSVVTMARTRRHYRFTTEAPTTETVVREARHRSHGVGEVGAGGGVALLDSVAQSADSSEGVSTRDACGVPAPTPPYPPQYFSSIAARVSKTGGIEIPDTVGANIDSVVLRVRAFLLGVGDTIDSQRSKQATGPPMIIRSFRERSAERGTRDSTTPLPGISGGASETDMYAPGGRGWGVVKHTSTASPQPALAVPSTPSPIVTPMCPRSRRTPRAASPRAWAREDNAGGLILSWDPSTTIANSEGGDKERLVAEDDGQDGTGLVGRSPAGGSSPFFPVRPVHRRGSPRGFGSPRVLGGSGSGRRERGCRTVRVPDAGGLPQTDGGMIGEGGRCADGGRGRGRPTAPGYF